MIGLERVAGGERVDPDAVGQVAGAAAVVPDLIVHDRAVVSIHQQDAAVTVLLRRIVLHYVVGNVVHTDSGPIVVIGFVLRYRDVGQRITGVWDKTARQDDPVEGAGPHPVLCRHGSCRTATERFSKLVAGLIG